MIGLGRVKGNKMVDMQIANNKLVDRAVKIIMKEKNIDYDTANGLLEKYGSVRNVILIMNKDKILRGLAVRI